MQQGKAIRHTPMLNKLPVAKAAYIDHVDCDGLAGTRINACRSATRPNGIVCRHLSPILLNDLVSGCASHQACTGLRRRKHFLTHHALGFTLGRFAAAHQLGYAQSDHAIAF
jgi:hypothetical protein